MKLHSCQVFCMSSVHETCLFAAVVMLFCSYLGFADFCVLSVELFMFLGCYFLLDMLPLFSVLNDLFFPLTILRLQPSFSL